MKIAKCKVQNVLNLQFCKIATGFVLPLLAVLILFAWVSGAIAQESQEWKIDRQLESDKLENQANEGFELNGLTDEDVKAISGIGIETKAGQSLLQVFVGGSSTPVLGTLHLVGHRLVFEPRFEQSETSYRIVFHGEKVRKNHVEPFVVFNRIRRTYVRGLIFPAKVYPNHAQLPQNILRMYIQTGEVESGNAYEHIRFTDSNGDTIESPFLEIPQELWSVDRTRLTLLFDPGRIKRGLARNEEFGPPFKIGETYTVIVDNEGLAGDGWRLIRDKDRHTTHTFTITEPDRTQPSIDRWKLKLPQRDTSEPLLVRFDEPLDYGMLQHSLRVVPVGEDAELQGDVSVTGDGLNWSFVPDQPWKFGDYQIVANPRLEDRSGNSLAQPFERPIVEGETEPAPLPEPKTTLRFAVRQVPRDKRVPNDR